MKRRIAEGRNKTELRDSIEKEEEREGERIEEREK